MSDVENEHCGIGERVRLRNKLRTRNVNYTDFLDIDDRDFDENGQPILISKRPIASNSNNIIVNRPLTLVLQKNHLEPEIKKIPRPANAFMIFANENRKSVAKNNPSESNKEISRRLGIMWKNLVQHDKELFFHKAKELDAEHKRMYPNYVYNPKEARIRKAMRERERSASGAQPPGNHGGHVGHPGASGGQRARRSPHWGSASGSKQQIAHISSTSAAAGAGLPDHLRKDLRSEMEQGFLVGNGGYIYPAQQYQFPQPADFNNYVQLTGTTPWLQNGYMQAPTMSQQQIWNQYHNDRARMHSSQQANPSYMMSPEQPQVYQNQAIEQPRHQMQAIQPIMPMKEVQPPQNPPQSVNTYMNISPEMPRASNKLVTDAEISQRVEDLQQIIAKANTTCDRAANVPKEIENTLEAPRDISTCGPELASDINLASNTPSSDAFDITGSLFGEDGITDLLDQKCDKLKPVKIENIPAAHSASQKPDLPNFLTSFQHVNMIQQNPQAKPPTIVPNNYYMEFLTPEYQIINQDSTKVKSQEKFFEPVLPNSLDIPVIKTEQYNGFLAEDVFGFVAFPSHEMQSGFGYHSPYEVYGNDHMGSANNFILDLSKVTDGEGFVDEIESCSSEKFAEVSSKIYDELAKII